MRWKFVLLFFIAISCLIGVLSVAMSGDKQARSRNSRKSSDQMKPVKTRIKVPQEVTVDPQRANKIFYVAPDGVAKGKGKINNPWDLQTALTSARVQPGDTIYLRGGTYRGVFESTLEGTPDAPITVRSYPGEWARIDGYRHTTLVHSISSTDTTITLADGTLFPNLSEIQVDNEVIQLKNKSGNQPATYTNCVRKRAGTDGSAAPHSANTRVSGRQSSIILVTGSWTHYRDFEVFNSNPVRVSTYTSSQPKFSGTRGGGINIQGPNNKFINLVIHDCGGGFGVWTGGDNAEIYGCIVFNNGFTAPDRGHGHGLYIQTTRGEIDVRRIIDVISFNNFATGMKAYTEGGASDRVHFEGIASFNNSSPHAVGPYGNLSERADSIFSGVRNGTDPQKHVVVRNNFLYLPPGVTTPNLQIGYTATGNELAEITGNYIMGGSQGFGALNFRSITFTGNTIYVTPIVNPRANAYVYSVSTADGKLTGYNWDNNTIYNTALEGNSSRKGLHKINGSWFDFSQWKSMTGYDRTSRENTTRPTGVWVFVRPNQYDPGRAHIIVYNWNLQSTVDVDVSGILSVGSSYEVRNVQDYLGSPVLSGNYSGGNLRLPMSGLRVAAPIGYGFTPQSTAPEFNVFVLIKR